jgi:hypothetical protein
MGMRLDHATLPDRIDSVEALDDWLARPGEALVRDLARLDGDIMILGAGGKMGPTLARLARNAAPHKRIVAVARFSAPGLRETRCTACRTCRTSYSWQAINSGRATIRR